jgi:hypothetical protein
VDNSHTRARPDRQLLETDRPYAADPGHAPGLVQFWGAKWGAISGRYQATECSLERLIYRLHLVSSDTEPYATKLEASFASRGSGVQIPSAPPRSAAGSHYGAGRFWSAHNSEVQQRRLAVASRRYGSRRLTPGVVATATTASTLTTEAIFLGHSLTPESAGHATWKPEPLRFPS